MKANLGAALFISYGSTLEVKMSKFSNMYSNTNGGIGVLNSVVDL